MCITASPERLQICVNKSKKPLQVAGTTLRSPFLLHEPVRETGHDIERGKRDVYCDKQVGKAVTVLSCVLKGSWGKGGSGGIRKKLKSEYAAYLESKYRRNDGSSI